MPELKMPKRWRKRMAADGLCLKCLAKVLHIYHDNGEINDDPAVNAVIAANRPPTHEGDGYERRDQDDE